MSHKRYHPTVKARMNRANRVAKCQKIADPDDGAIIVCERCEVTWHVEDKKPKCLTRREVGEMWIKRIHEMNAKAGESGG